MNIFVLHALAEVNARMHCDVHVVKMLVETAQILYSVLRLWKIHLGFVRPIRCSLNYKRKAGRVALEVAPNSAYKLAHPGHPVVLWAAAARPHAQWLLDLGLSLADQFRRRYGGEHGSARHLQDMRAADCFSTLPATTTVADWAMTLSHLSVASHVIASAVAAATTCSPPSGCAFGVVCVNPDADAATEVFAYVNGAVDLVATYRRFHVYKAKVSMNFAWAGSPTPPPEFGNLFETVFATKPMLGSAEVRAQNKRKREEKLAKQLDIQKKKLARVGVTV